MKNYKKLAFDFDINMVDYLNANTDILIHKIVMDTIESSVYKVMPGIKYGELIPIFNTGDIDTIAYAGNSCEFVGGDIALAERELKVCQYNIQKNWCDDQLNSTILSLRLSPGSYAPNLEVSVEEAFMNDIIKKANVFISRKFWGATTASDGCSGVIEQLESAAFSAETINLGYTALTTSNATSVVDAYITSLPDPLKVITTIMALNHGDFQALQLSLRNQNLYHYNPSTLENGQMMINIPFTNVVAISCEIPSGYMVLTNSENLYFGCDLMSDVSSPISWYSNDFQQTRMKLATKLGSTIGVPSQVVFAS